MGYVSWIITIIGVIATAVVIALMVKQIHSGESLLAAITSWLFWPFIISLGVFMVGISSLIGDWYYKEVEGINFQFEKINKIKIFL